MKVVSIRNLGFLISLFFSFFLIQRNVYAEEYRCFYQLNNEENSYQLKRKNSYFLWRTKSGKQYKLSIIKESPNEIVLGGEFFFPELNYYKIYFLDKNPMYSV